MKWSNQMVTEESQCVTDEAARDEAGWLAQALAGDPEAFGNICRLHEGPLLRQAFALGCSTAAAEDLVEETLVEAWKSLRRYNGTCRLSTWLCAILLNRNRNHLRRQRWLWFVGSDDRTLEGVAATDVAPDATAAANDEAALLRKCIAALPARQQQVIFLRFYADDSLEGIAAVTRCSVGTVKSRLFHALEKLRHMKALQRTPQATLPGPCPTVPANHLVLI